ncbi:unknown [Singapore grouper iridovirus]|uniref:Uncharacterized protein n=1 Tax=Singapore grouper iridovirus TaxID=262968 RepID=Q5YFJ6_9VIRU|nr:hypothetical protein ORF069L [Singapore grouper iridovirus]AAS18084.1 unknown [Singapore grouper iridovirus]WAU86778.1 hypothetical protein ORF069L [Singapore grouper iridovirus]
MQLNTFTQLRRKGLSIAKEVQRDIEKEERKLKKKPPIPKLKKHSQQTFFATKYFTATPAQPSPLPIDPDFIRAQRAIGIPKKPGFVRDVDFVRISELPGLDAMKMALTLAPLQTDVSVNEVRVCHYLTRGLPASLIRTRMRLYGPNNDITTNKPEEMAEYRRLMKMRKVDPPTPRKLAAKRPKIEPSPPPETLAKSVSHPRTLIPQEKMVSIMTEAPWLNAQNVRGVILPAGTPGSLPAAGNKASRKWYLDNWLKIRMFQNPPVAFLKMDGTVMPETPEMYAAYVNYLQSYGKAVERAIPPPSREALRSLLDIYVKTGPEYADSLAAALPLTLPANTYEDLVVRAVAYAVPAFSGKNALLHQVRLREGRYAPNRFFGLLAEHVFAEIYTDRKLLQAWGDRIDELIQNRMKELRTQYRSIAVKDFTTRAKKTPALDMRHSAPDNLIPHTQEGDAMVSVINGKRAVVKAVPTKLTTAVDADLLAALQEPVYPPEEVMEVDRMPVIPEEVDYKADLYKKPKWTLEPTLIDKLNEYLDTRIVGQCQLNNGGI